MNHDLDGALRLATLHRRSEQDNRAATCPRQVTPAGWDSARSHDRRRQANPSRSQLTWGWADLATVQSATTFVTFESKTRALIASFQRPKAKVSVSVFKRPIFPV
ncbi:hypothetical protein VTN96DRAFT_10318 [Rasamsonia emersonii]